MPDSQGFFAELKRRHVIRASVAHILLFWILVQVADVVLPYIGVVDEPVRWALVAGVALFPVTLIAAWFLEHPWHRFTGSRLIVDFAVIAVIAVVAGTWVMRNLPQVILTKTSIVILPFAHSGAEHEQGLSRALAYEINSLLMRSKSIDVIGFESSSSSLLTGLGSTAVASRLKVANVLSGNVSMSGDAMSIEVRLLDAAGELLWNSLIEESLDNIFAVQERIATSIETRLGAGDDTVPVAEVSAQRCWMPTDASALEKYYTARHLIELRSDTDEAVQGLHEAAQLYEELIEAYPNFAGAYGGLAWAHTYMSVYDRENVIAEWHKEAQRLSTIALTHCATLGEAIHLLPNEYDHENGWIGAHQQLTAFIEMEPHKTENYQKLARHYLNTGHQLRSVEVSERNFALNPLSVRSIKELAFSLMHVDRLQESSEMFELATELGSTGVNYAAGMMHLDECGIDIECQMTQMPPDYLAFVDRLRPVYRIPSSSEEAQESIDIAIEVLNENPEMWMNWFNGSACQFDYLAPLFFRAWERKKALDVNWYWPRMWNRDCEDVWSMPEFPPLVEEVGFVEYWREVGWPEACQPDGDSFACGNNIAKLETE